MSCRQQNLRRKGTCPIHHPELETLYMMFPAKRQSIILHYVLLSTALPKRSCLSFNGPGAFVRWTTSQLVAGISESQARDLEHAGGNLVGDLVAASNCFQELTALCAVESWRSHLKHLRWPGKHSAAHSAHGNPTCPGRSYIMPSP